MYPSLSSMVLFKITDWLKKPKRYICLAAIFNDLKLTEGRDHLYTTESWQGRRWETCDAEALVDAGTCYPGLSFPTHSRDRKGDALQGRSVPTLPNAPPALGASHCPVQQEEFLPVFPQHLELQHLGIPTFRQIINAQHVMKPPHIFFSTALNQLLHRFFP